MAVITTNKTCLRKAKNQLEKHQMGFDGEHIGEVVLKRLGYKNVMLTSHKSKFDILTAREAWEIKTVGRDALDKKMSIKAKQKVEKLAWAKKNKKSPKSMMVIVNDSAEVYVRDGLGKFRSGGMKKVATYKDWRKEVGHGRTERLVEGKPFIRLPPKAGKEGDMWVKGIMKESENFQGKYGLGSCGPVADNIVNNLQAAGREARVVLCEYIGKGEKFGFTHYMAVEFEKRGKKLLPVRMYDPTNPFTVIHINTLKWKLPKEYTDSEIFKEAGRSVDDGLFTKEMVDWWKDKI